VLQLSFVAGARGKIHTECAGYEAALRLARRIRFGIDFYGFFAGNTGATDKESAAVNG
jgi:hypothetical protein